MICVDGQCSTRHESTLQISSAHAGGHQDVLENVVCVTGSLSWLLAAIALSSTAVPSPDSEIARGCMSLGYRVCDMVASFL
jgi:hypothetical protein